MICCRYCSPVFIFAGLLLPLLLDFGLLEFVGTMMTRIMRPVFRLPGRSAVDCFASWLGDGSVGILLTQQTGTKASSIPSGKPPSSVPQLSLRLMVSVWW